MKGPCGPSILPFLSLLEECGNEPRFWSLKGTQLDGLQRSFQLIGIQRSTTHFSSGALVKVGRESVKGRVLGFQCKQVQLITSPVPLAMIFQPNLHWERLVGGSERPPQKICEPSCIYSSAQEILGKNRGTGGSTWV